MVGYRPRINHDGSWRNRAVVLRDTRGRATCRCRCYIKMWRTLLFDNRLGKMRGAGRIAENGPWMCY